MTIASLKEMNEQRFSINEVKSKSYIQNKMDSIDENQSEAFYRESSSFSNTNNNLLVSYYFESNAMMNNETPNTEPTPAIKTVTNTHPVVINESSCCNVLNNI